MKTPPTPPEKFNINPDDLEFLDTNVPSGAALNIIMQDIMNRQAGKVAPDTIGVDYFFVDGFITDEMDDDFYLIEKEFLKHCCSKLQNYEVQASYGGDFLQDSDPMQFPRRKVLTYIYNGAKSGDAYCLSLIQYLFKTYHKKEYKQLRRFRRIKVSEILALAEEEVGKPDDARMGRIMGMCTFMGIEMEESCSLLYLLLEKRRKESLEELELFYEDEPFNRERYDQCVRQVDEWCEEEKIKNVRRRFSVYWDDETFIEKCLNHFGYPDDYAYRCAESGTGVRMQMVRSLNILKKISPKKEFTFEEVQRHAQLYGLVEALVEASDRFEEETQNIFGEGKPEFADEKHLFSPENVVVKMAEKQTVKAEKNSAANIAPVSLGSTKEEDYLAEIAELRKKLHAQEQENRHLRDLNRSMKTAQKESERLLESYQNDREELIALREFAYHSAEEYEELPEATLEDMKQEIAGRKIAIIGGHVNWINKLGKLFPDWMLIHNETFKTVDGKMLDGMDHVYFFTDHISHSTYNKFIAAVRERDIPFGYLHSINTEQMIQQIYEDII